MDYCSKKVWSINDIKIRATECGSNWFNPCVIPKDEVILDAVYNGPGGIYFISKNSKSYDVKQFFPNKGVIEHVGTAENEDIASALAKCEAEENLQDKLDRVLCQLDLCITGSNKSRSQSKYGYVEEIILGSIIYLSDGGYTRCVAKSYYDGTGYALKLIETGATDRKPAWFSDEGTKIREQLERVLRIYDVLEYLPSELTIKTEKYQPFTLAECFATVLRKHANENVSVTDAGKLIDKANLHQEYMEANWGNPNCTSAITICRQDIEEFAKRLGVRGVVFFNDPRISNVRLVFADGFSDDFEKVGYRVPTKGCTSLVARQWC